MEWSVWACRFLPSTPMAKSKSAPGVSTRGQGRVWDGEEWSGSQGMQECSFQKRPSGFAQLLCFRAAAAKAALTAARPAGSPMHGSGEHKPLAPDNCETLSKQDQLHNS